MRSRLQKAEATAEVFWTAFCALPKTERSVVFRRFVADKQFREDLLDLAVFAERRQEASRPFRDYLKGRTRKTA